jgi:hypothetical protein
VGGGSLDHEGDGRRNPARLGSIATLGPREVGGKRVVGAPTHPAADYTVANVGRRTLVSRVRHVRTAFPPWAGWA